MADDSEDKLTRFADSASLKLASRISSAAIFPLLFWALNSLDSLRLDMAAIKASLDARLPAIEHRLDSLEIWRNTFDKHGGR